MRVAGFVLTGGRSSRMGRDKARLPVESHLLVEDVAAKLTCITPNVALIGGAHRYRDLGLECLDDLRLDCGPLAGIETALTAGRGHLNLILACDMPGLQVEWLQRLLDKAAAGESACVTVQDGDGMIHPLCAVWKPICLPQIRNALDAGRLQVLSILDELKTEFLPLSGPLHNVNTPGEWQAWKRKRVQESTPAS